MNLLNELYKKTNIQYVAVKISNDSKVKIEKFLKENKIKNALSKDKLHITVMYSTTVLDMDDGVLDKKIKEFRIPKKFDVFKTQDGNHALVVILDCEYLKDRHKYWKSKNGSYTYSEYKVHITLSYDIGENFDISKLDIKTFPIVELVEEYREPLNLDFAKS